MTATGLQSRPIVRAAGVSEGFRPDIQGLRAVAVLLVVLYHLWPNRLTGGYVGVDVFFVISGFLITLHLLREAETTGRVQVAAFWARRVKRLLPASFLVLAVTLGAVVLFSSPTSWAQAAREVAASALYVENWALAGDAADYMAADNVPSAVQHYWSLSVEEQFYLLWPLVVLGLVVLGRRRGAARVTPWLLGGTTAVVAVSLVLSVVATSADRSAAYFFTYARAWEFLAGALVALAVASGAATPLRPSARARSIIALAGAAGLAMILAAALVYDDASPFPGWIAIVPVVGTATLLLVGGGVPGATGTAVGRLLSWRPATFVGDISYSVYLWHWPLIVLLPDVTGRSLSTTDKLGILVGAIVLGWLTKVLVEDPARRSRLLGARPWRALAFAVVGSLVLVGATVAVRAELAAREARADAVAAALAEGIAACEGPSALLDEGCGEPTGEDGYLVPPEVVAQQNLTAPYPDCQSGLGSVTVVSCELGYTGPDPARVIALVGDSHGTHWFPAFDAVGSANHWLVRTYTKASCPMSSVPRVLSTEPNLSRQLSCETWKASTLEALRADPAIDTVVTTSFSSSYEWAGPDGTVPTDARELAATGFAQVWQGWLDEGRDVVVLATVPRTNGERIPNCLAGDPATGRITCAVPRDRALPLDPLVAAAGRTEDVRLLDLTDAFCDDDLCYPVVGDLIVYRDRSHLTKEYATALAPLVTEALLETGPDRS